MHYYIVYCRHKFYCLLVRDKYSLNFFKRKDSPNWIVAGESRYILVAGLTALADFDDCCWDHSMVAWCFLRGCVVCSCSDIYASQSCGLCFNKRTLIDWLITMQNLNCKCPVFWREPPGNP